MLSSTLRDDDALIETIAADAQGIATLWPFHAARLHHSARSLGYAPPPADLEDRVRREALRVTETPVRRVRLLLHRDGRASIQATALPALIVPAKVALATDVLGPDAFLDSREPLLQHKTTQRPWYEAATAWLADHPAYFDLLFLNESGKVCEGSRSNVYALCEGEWSTPPASCGCLPGVRRAALLAENKVSTAVLKREDLFRAQALRLSNGLRGWFDVALEQ